MTDVARAGRLRVMLVDDHSLVRAAVRQALDAQGIARHAPDEIVALACADLDAVVSFHGSLPLPNGSEARNIKWRVLVEHGNADAFVPPERAEAFKAAMNDAGVELVFHGYDGVRHAFTNPDAGSFGIDNLKYDEAADQASWREMLQTLNTVF